MEYTLMHKNIPVLEIELDEATSSIQKLGAVHHLEHLPLGTVSKHGVIDRAALNDGGSTEASPPAGLVSAKHWKR